MKKITAFFASLSLVLVLSAPIAIADETHTGELPPPPSGGRIVWPSKGHFGVYELLPFLVGLEWTVSLI